MERKQKNLDNGSPENSGDFFEISIKVKVSPRLTSAINALGPNLNQALETLALLIGSKLPNIDQALDTEKPKSAGSETVFTDNIHGHPSDNPVKELLAEKSDSAVLDKIAIDETKQISKSKKKEKQTTRKAIPKDKKAASEDIPSSRTNKKKLPKHPGFDDQLEDDSQTDHDRNLQKVEQQNLGKFLLQQKEDWLKKVNPNENAFFTKHGFKKSWFEKICNGRKKILTSKAIELVLKLKKGVSLDKITSGKVFEKSNLGIEPPFSQKHKGDLLSSKEQELLFDFVDEFMNTDRKKDQLLKKAFLSELLKNPSPYVELK